MNIMDHIHEKIAEKQVHGRIPTAIVLNEEAYAHLQMDFYNRYDCFESITEFAGLPVLYNNESGNCQVIITVRP
jgi:hypothetical protein